YYFVHITKEPLAQHPIVNWHTPKYGRGEWHGTLIYKEVLYIYINLHVYSLTTLNTNNIYVINSNTFLFM
ncbi:hypothetical protein ACJX0J_010218, partial [Zea mays]